MAKRPTPERYSAIGLVKHGLSRRPWSAVFGDGATRDRYDVAIVGGGVHGLASAYYLAERHGVRSVAVLEKGYIGGGNSGRNTAIVRSNYLTPQGIAFYRRSLELYQGLTSELNFNVMFEPRGQLTLGHDDGAIRTLRWRAEVNKALGVQSSMVGPDECQRLIPQLDLAGGGRYPVIGGLWHPAGGIIRHDAVVWGYARAASAHGVHVRQDTEVLGLRKVGDGFQVTTNRGMITAATVINCTAGWASTVANMLGLALPIQSVPLQAAVTEPVKPLFKPILSSSNLHVYVSQTSRGELVLGGAVDAYASYSTRGSLDFLERLSANLLNLLPALAKVRVLRQWAGVCDMTPDAAPIIGLSPIEGFLLDVGWGTYGFKAGPAAGEAVAELAVTGRVPELIHPFSLDRFATGRLVNEKGAAAVGH
jgi:sarcosine oxidase, subunit beta